MKVLLALAFAACAIPALAQQTPAKAGKWDARCRVEGDRERWNDRATDSSRWSDRGATGKGRDARLPPCDPKNPYASTRPGDPNPYATRAGDPNPYATKAGMPNPYATKAGTRNPYAPPPAGTPKR
jgi:hypothetical protein